MHAITVIVAQSDCIVAEHLAATLHSYFKNVVVARDMDEIRHHVKRDLADVAVIDLDLAAPEQLQQLVREFRNVGIVCTHRAPDDEMWRLCLELGALDCCSCSDIQGIVRAAHRGPHHAMVANSAA